MPKPAARQPEPRYLNVGNIHTQANNFLGTVQSQVDPRTGQFNLSIDIPLPMANNLSGPSWSATLAFSSMASHVDAGFGRGWSLLFSEMLIGPTWTLRLSTGEQFSVDLNSSDLNPGGRLQFYDYKLQAMQVYMGNDSEIKIFHKNGETEILRKVQGTGAGYKIHELRSAEGRRIFFDWIITARIEFLQTVRDETRTLAEFDRTSEISTLTLAPDSPAEAVYTFRRANDRLNQFLLPMVEEPFQFGYQAIAVGNNNTLLFPTAVTGPLGASDTISWTNGKTVSHEFPRGAPIDFLPRVHRWQHVDSRSEPYLVRSYSWSDRKNFLGFNSAQSFGWVAGRDNIYQLREKYQYGITETQRDGDNNLLATITSTWDRHHLLIHEKTVVGEHETVRDIEYGVDYDKPWQDQSPQCQLPVLITTTYHDTGSDCTLSETTHYTYDSFGNVLSSTLPTEATEVSEYYASAGESGCPPDSLGMTRFLKRKTLTPAPGHPGHAPTLTTRYEYEALPSLISGEADHVVVCLEELRDDSASHVLENTVQSYDRQQGEHYGRQKKAVTTLNGMATTTSLDYAITHDCDEGPLLWTTTTTSGFEDNAVTTSSTQDARSLLTGLTRCQVGTAGVKTLFAFDLLGRAVKTVIADGTDYRVERTCDFHLDDEFIDLNAPRFGDGSLVTVGIEETDATGQRKRSWLDGASRPLVIQLEHIDAEPGRFLEIEAISYDPFGREVQRTTSDYDGDGNVIFALTTTTAYDGWGNVHLQTSPSGIKTHTLHDPTQRRMETWQESPSGNVSSKQVTLSNAAGSPVEVVLMDDRQQIVRTVSLIRDGLDRVIEQRTIPRTGVAQVIQFEYDSYSRLTARLEHFQPDPDNDEVSIRITRWQYAAHSDGDHKESVTVELGDTTAVTQRAAP